MIEFSEESLEVFIEESLEHFTAQWLETEMYQDKLVLDPNWDMYYAMESKGMLASFTARDEGNLIGYAVYFLSPHQHHKEHLTADSDIVYLEPSYRGTGIAFDLYSYAESKLKEKGVSVIMLRMKDRIPFEPLANKLGYSKEEIAYAKWIGD